MNEEQKSLGYVPFTKDTQSTVISKYEAHDKFNSVITTTASSDTSRTRKGYFAGDYYRARPQDIVPTKFNDVVQMCRNAYLRVGVVRNVIDLMTDFACEDVKLIHTDKNVEAFFKVWMKKVKLQDAVDEFVRRFLLDANVVVRRRMAKITEPVENQWTERTIARTETVPDPEKLYVERLTNKREIPWKYTFLNVAALYWKGGELSKLAGEKKLAFKPAKELVNAVRSPVEPFQKTLVDRIPGYSKTALLGQDADGLIDINMDTVYVTHNKKDSWEDWAPPFLFSILSDLQFKDKLRQAEISALDGMINVIRLWKLGDHTEGFLPGEAPIDKLVGILENNTGGGAIDIVWDSMIEMVPYYPPVEKILGSEKYEQVNRDILIGLGVPEVLIGGHGANFSNSFIQLKTLVEKLKYIRGKVREWLEHELMIVCEAMDIKVLPRVRFPQNNLEDENISRKLVVGLLDRGVISVQSVLEMYGEDFLIEAQRINNEKKANLDVKSPLDPKPAAPGKPVSKGPGGRPSQTKDVSRKTREAKPRRSMASFKDLSVKALDAIDMIDKVVVPQYLDSIGVSNSRKLTASQKQDVDNLRVIVLSCINPKDDITEDKVSELALQADLLYDPKIVNRIKQEIDDFTEKNKAVPTLDQKKRIEAITWGLLHESNNE